MMRSLHAHLVRAFSKLTGDTWKKTKKLTWRTRSVRIAENQSYMKYMMPHLGLDDMAASAHATATSAKDVVVF